MSAITHQQSVGGMSTLSGNLRYGLQIVAFIKGTRTQPQCGFSYKVLTMLNEARVNYEVVNVLDEQFNPGLREAIKTYSQWPTIPQVNQTCSLPCTVCRCNAASMLVPSWYDCFVQMCCKF